MVVYHDVHSVAKLVEAYRIAKAFGIKTFVVSRPQGAAAQSGIPEISVLAFQDGIKFAVLPDIKDLTLLSPSKIIILSKRAEKPFDPAELDENSALVICGTEPDVSKKDLVGEPRYVEPRDLPETARLVLALGMMRPTSDEG
jgi:SpoU rRNA methylase family enzyme